MSLVVTLPDGAERRFEDGASPMDVATSISGSLAKKALAAKVDGELWDLTRPIDTKTAKVEIVTAKDPEGMELIRHDAAHVLAQAVQALYPGTQVTIGPVIEDGFYYDFARETPFSTDDFEMIEAKMAEIIDADYPIVREVWEKGEAIETFKSIGEDYKAQIIDDIIPPSQPITIYRQGDWYDLCRGPHLPSTGKLPKAFKLMKLAGAYWRGDHRNEMLQRVYGTAWADPKQLKAHLRKIEEAEKRDHRRLGKDMSLFHLQDEAQGQVFWHPNGWTVYRALQDYMRRRQDEGGYKEVRTPQLMDREFWEKSGHWEKYRENMFISSIEEEDKVLAVKPMNCPCHIELFKTGQKSYRDLPMRMAEFGSCHRYEASGALHGLMRVRAFVQDDGHVFCREDQITEEVKAFCALLQSVYADLGFDDVVVKFSDRPEKRVGSDDVWDRAEESLRTAADATGLEVLYNPGDGAFYGPKLDFVLRDAIGREWQVGTIQADFNLPGRLGAVYVGEDGEKHTPVMLHRAILGSFERFLGILIENYAGAFPMWLAPVQIVVANIASSSESYAIEAAEILRKAGMRVETDLRNEKINYKVREHSVAKVPLIAVVGDREAEERTLAIRRFGGGNNQEMMSLDDAVKALGKEALAPDLQRASN